MNESILVVDDDTEVRETLSSVLLDEGYLVEAVKSGKDAIRASETAYFDVALIDMELPDMKGIEILRRLKEKQPGMVRIIITGFPSLENAVKAVNEGAHGYVLKPFNMAELLKMIRKRLDEKATEYLHMRTEMEKNTVFSHLCIRYYNVAGLLPARLSCRLLCSFRILHELWSCVSFQKRMESRLYAVASAPAPPSTAWLLPLRLRVLPQWDRP